MKVKVGDKVLVIAGKDKGGIFDIEAPIHVSNVKVINNNKEEKAKVVKSEAKKETSKKKTTSKKEAK